MADAARPTPGAHARTALSQATTRGSQQRPFRRWSKLASQGSFRAPELVSSSDAQPRAPSTRVHDAVLWLAGCLVAWVRAWDALIATSRVCTGLLGCIEMVLITTVAAMRSKLGRGQWMPHASGAPAALLLRAAPFSKHVCTRESAARSHRSDRAAIFRADSLATRVVEGA